MSQGLDALGVGGGLSRFGLACGTMTKTPQEKSGTRQKPIKPEEIELHPDAWERFEDGMKTIAKTPSKPRPFGYNEGDPMPTCDACHGTGKRGGADCPECRGHRKKLVAQGDPARIRGDPKPRGTKTKGNKAP